MSLLLAVTGWDEAPWIERFKRHLPEHPILTPATLTDRASIRYGVSWRHAPGAFAGLPNLKALFSLGAGVDHMARDPLLPHAPIVRVVDPDLRDRMSEWVVMHALMHLRGVRRLERQQAARAWRDDPNQPAARDVRVGLMGLGALGADAARKLSLLGFRTMGWSRTARALADVESFHGADGLGAMLARTDILVCLLPLTEATRGILNARLFAKLARDGRLGGPVLLNAGRGGLQVETDILAALDDGTLKAASLDVFETEPLPQASPLWAHSDIWISPHDAAMSEPDAVARTVAASILAFERGEPLRNVVDPALGY